MTEREHGGQAPALEQTSLEGYRGLPPGWYRDRSDPTLARYWDGTALSLETRRVAPSSATSTPGVQATEPRPGASASPGSSASPGWYRDRAEPGLARFWDGRRWTEATQPLEALRAAPPARPASSAPSVAPPPQPASPAPPPDRTADATRGSQARKTSIFKRAPFWVTLALVVLAAVGLVLTELGKNPKPSETGASATSIASTTTAPTTTIPAPTSTAPAVPASPQPTADKAANVLIDNWASGNRAVALEVATPAAVSALFAAQYVSGLAIDRGCSDGNPPVTCTFGPPGGADPNDPIYSLTVAQASDGYWYVSAAQVEG